jgi:hypothetical protein
MPNARSTGNDRLFGRLRVADLEKPTTAAAALLLEHVERAAYLEDWERYGCSAVELTARDAFALILSGGPGFDALTHHQALRDQHRLDHPPRKRPMDARMAYYLGVHATP